jgi:hypothetical protein
LLQLEQNNSLEGERAEVEKLAVQIEKTLGKEAKNPIRPVFKFSRFEKEKMLRLLNPEVDYSSLKPMCPLSSEN